MLGRSITKYPCFFAALAEYTHETRYAVASTPWRRQIASNQSWMVRHLLGSSICMSGCRIMLSVDSNSLQYMQFVQRYCNCISAIVCSVLKVCCCKHSWVKADCIEPVMGHWLGSSMFMSGCRIMFSVVSTSLQHIQFGSKG